MDETAGRIVAVTILKTIYHLRTNGSEEYVHELAELVDRKMAELYEQTSTADTSKLAILAALSIADEYLSLRRKSENLDREIEEFGAKMIAVLEPSLESEVS